MDLLTYLRICEPQELVRVSRRVILYLVDNLFFNRRMIGG
jgi:hypothetical protein